MSEYICSRCQLRTSGEPVTYSDRGTLATKVCLPCANDMSMKNAAAAMAAITFDPKTVTGVDQAVGVDRTAYLRRLNRKYGEMTAEEYRQYLDGRCRRAGR
jgi:uncharacterized OB-fold protein